MPASGVRTDDGVPFELDHPDHDARVDAKFGTA